ncbi:asialoglycoprotein receptor 2-like isoform X2 [Pseudorasbora parva]|uniref:asialoglycoprotein receptor 2-like isoform X2 n=1 Tax=Pseudorasbora parva TaxID=51549 RepID=UPI00351F5DEB
MIVTFEDWMCNEGRPCSRQTGVFVLLGTVCMIIFIITTSVICNDLEKKVSELQNLVSSLSSSLNTSGSSNPMTNELQEKLSNIETLMTNLGSSHSNLEEKLQKLADSLMSSVVSLRPYSRTQHISSSGSGCTVSDWIPFSKSCYLFSHDTLNWTQAKDFCEKQGALLLKIEDGSEEEWDFVTSFADSEHYWVGLTDKDTGKWRYADDTPYTINKAHWKTGQPDDWTEHGLGEKGEEGEDCGEITYEGLLNDIHCSSKLKYICEKGMQD